MQSPISICGNESYTLKAIGSCNSVVWNNGSTARDLAITNLTQNASYYFDCINSTPMTYAIRSEIVDFKVNPVQYSNNVVFPEGSIQNFNAQKIQSSSIFGNNSDILMQGSKQIILELGFYFNGHKSFVGEIKDCLE